MSQPTRAQYVTANDLLTGEVMFLAADGRWVPDLVEAMLCTNPDAAAQRLAQAEADGARVVGPYLAEVAGDGGCEGAKVPVHFRERFRTTGPSNYFHGKQERAAHV